MINDFGGPNTPTFLYNIWRIWRAFPNPEQNHSRLCGVFFSHVRLMCEGTQNTTAFVYGYNVNGYTTKALARKQISVYQLQEALSYFNGEQGLPWRINNDGIVDMVEWFVELWSKDNYLHSTRKTSSLRKVTKIHFTIRFPRLYNF